MPPSDASPPPVHCPNPACEFHAVSRGWRYKRAGFYVRGRPPWRVQRYRCSHCRRAFSSQTFSTTYWLKRPDLQIAILHGEVGGSGHRQMGRQHGVAHSTIQRHVARLGRHCLLRHELLRESAAEKLGHEPVILDGLRSFAGGQYWPLEITNLISAHSYYSHDFVVSERRRSGAMTDLQRKRRAAYEKKLGCPDSQGLYKDVLEILEASLLPGQAIELRSDEEQIYLRVLKQLNRPEIMHQTTASTAPRTPHNPLFAINSHHNFMRHSGSNQKRETIAFSKKLPSVIWRHAIHQTWVNEVKSASERGGPQTPAQRLGVRERPLTVPDLLERRLFPGRMALRPRTAEYYAGRKPSRFLARERVHELKYAF